ncbi:hypothetical protein AC578_7544 [Pseudocercospora eumusae]|uniref:Uncharacterized protein n=1 Tax=Pseudocercospora eumusae TaxID=321146 RepID=A0A139HRS2_9PEZI|nr:hypothetical protein AC578_7544 [Pseudocercospora eumusae]
MQEALEYWPSVASSQWIERGTFDVVYRFSVGKILMAPADGLQFRISLLLAASSQSTEAVQFHDLSTPSSSASRSSPRGPRAKLCSQLKPAHDGIPGIPPPDTASASILKRLSRDTSNFEAAATSQPQSL